MMQQSIYVKLALNNTTAESIKERVRKHKTPKGLVQMLVVTEKQFASIEYVVGTGQETTIDSTSRLVVL